MIDFDRESELDVLESIGTKRSYELSLELIRSGFLVGPSSGMALAGLFAYLKKAKNSGTLLDLQINGKCSAVCICPDGPYPYLDEYFKYCDGKLFPAVINSELLLNKEGLVENNSINLSTNIDSIRLFSFLYPNQPNLPQTLLQLDSKRCLVDLRTPEEYQHVHLYGAINIPFEKLNFQDFESYRDKKICLVCNYGKKSALWAKTLREV